MFHVFPHLGDDARETLLERRWTVGAFKLAPVDVRFRESLVGLGRLDVSLRALAPEWHHWLTGMQSCGNAGPLNDYQTLSALWVFGAYEAIRTLSRRLGQKAPQSDHLKTLLKSLTRIRIPLAKFEAANGSRHSDRGSPQNLFQRTRGAAWVLNDQTTVYREDLAEEILATLDQFDHNEVSTLLARSLADKTHRS